MNWKRLSKTDPDLLLLLEGPVRKYVLKSRWYGGKASNDKAFFADHLLPLDDGRSRYYLLILEILYEEGFVHNYLLPLAKVSPEKVESKDGVICPFPESDDLLIDAVHDPGFRRALFRKMKNERRVSLEGSQLEMQRGRSLRSFDIPDRMKSRLLGVEQSNTSIIYEDAFILKLYRRLFRDSNPDIEMAQFLSERTRFKNIPAFAASITWTRPNTYEISLGMMQELIPNDGDAWAWMLEQLDHAMDRVDIETMEMWQRRPYSLARILKRSPT
ncbi:MAG: hypothetical protein HKN79_04650 [Flavobacteriales bacterium]|nr:hypothetical protein [Flavobacteriales bacterium]